MDRSLQCDIVQKMHKLHISKGKVTMAVLGYTLGYSWRPMSLPVLQKRHSAMGEKNLIYDKHKKKDRSIRNNDLGASSADRGELSEQPRTDRQMSFIEQMATVKGKASPSMDSLIHRAITCLCFEHHWKTLQECEIWMKRSVHPLFFLSSQIWTIAV